MRLDAVFNDYKPAEGYDSWEECLESCRKHESTFYGLLKEYEREGRFRDSILVDKQERRVLNGHHRLAVLSHVGAEVIPLTTEEPERTHVEYVLSGEVSKEGYVLMMARVFGYLSYAFDKDTWITIDFASGSVDKDIFTLTLICPLSEKDMSKVEEIGESLRNRVGAEEVSHSIP